MFIVVRLPQDFGSQNESTRENLGIHIRYPVVRFSFFLGLPLPQKTSAESFSSEPLGFRRGCPSYAKPAWFDTTGFPTPVSCFGGGNGRRSIQISEAPPPAASHAAKAPQVLKKRNPQWKGRPRLRTGGLFLTSISPFGVPAQHASWGSEKEGPFPTMHGGILSQHPCLQVFLVPEKEHILAGPQNYCWVAVFL